MISLPRRHRVSGGGRGKRTEGEEASEVFKLFAQGKDLEEVVIEACVPPRRVRALYHEWIISLDQGERIRERQERETAARRTAKDEERRQAKHEAAMRDLEEAAKKALRK